MSAYTVQAGFAVYCYATVTVEANSIEDACRAAIEEASADERWKASDHVGNAFIAAIGEGADACPWSGPVSALPVPDDFQRTRRAAAHHDHRFRPVRRHRRPARYRPRPVRRQRGHRYDRDIRPAAATWQQARRHGHAPRRRATRHFCPRRQGHRSCGGVERRQRGGGNRLNLPRPIEAGPAAKGRSARKVEDSGARSLLSLRPAAVLQDRGGGVFSRQRPSWRPSMPDIEAPPDTTPAGSPPAMHPMDPSRGQDLSPKFVALLCWALGFEPLTEPAITGVVVSGECVFAATTDDLFFNALIGSWSDLEANLPRLGRRLRSRSVHGRWTGGKAPEDRAISFPDLPKGYDRHRDALVIINPGACSPASDALPIHACRQAIAEGADQRTDPAIHLMATQLAFLTDAKADLDLSEYQHLMEVCRARAADRRNLPVREPVA